MSRPRPSTNTPFYSRLEQTTGPRDHQGSTGAHVLHNWRSSQALGVRTKLPKHCAAAKPHHFKHHSLRVGNQTYLNDGPAQVCGATLVFFFSQKNFELVLTPRGRIVQCPLTQSRYFFKIAKKNGDEKLAIFCSWNGGLGVARLRRPPVRPSVLKPKTRVSESPKKAKSRKK